MKSGLGWVGLLSLLLPNQAYPSSTLDERLKSPPIPHSHPFDPTLPLSLIMFNDDIIYPPSTKDYIPQPLYVCQPYSLQIIQLVECSPPPPQQQRQKYTPSMISSSSYSDSSESDSDSSAYDSSSSSLFAGSSYCSSAAEDSATPAPPSFDNRDPSVDDTYRTRQRRVSLWRDAVHSKNVANSGSSVALVGLSFLTDPCFSHTASIIIFIIRRIELDSNEKNSSSSRFSFPKAKMSRGWW